MTRDSMSLSCAPQRILSTVLNLNGSFQEIWDRYSVEIDAMLFKYSHIPYLMKSLMLIRACGDIALSPMTFELTLDLYKTIQMSNYKSNLESSKYNEVIIFALSSISFEILSEEIQDSVLGLIFSE